MPTDAGRAQAAKALLDEQRWAIVRRLYADTARAGRYDGVTPIEAALTRDEIAEIDRQLGPPQEVRA
jgi:manganese/zinc/iron transport system permease protein